MSEKEYDDNHIFSLSLVSFRNKRNPEHYEKSVAFYALKILQNR